MNAPLFQKTWPSPDNALLLMSQLQNFFKRMGFCSLEILASKNRLRHWSLQVYNPSMPVPSKKKFQKASQDLPPAITLINHIPR